MTIACLGWGSLIWKPGTLPVSGNWNTDGPWLPVEFARQSKSGAVTLVVVSGARPVQTLWALLKVPGLPEAREALRKREGTVPRYIGSWPNANAPKDEILKVVENWAALRKLDGVVWTALPPKWNGLTGVVPTIEQVLDHLRGQGAHSKAERYIRKAPAQVRTTYRACIEAEAARVLLCQSARHLP